MYAYEPATNLDLFKNIYINPTKILGINSQLFKSWAAILNFKELLTRHESFRNLFVEIRAECIVFWVAIEPNTYDSRDPLIDEELKLREKFPDKNFVFRIIEDTKEDCKRIPIKSIHI